MTAHAFALAMAALDVNGPEDAATDWDAINWHTHEDHVRRLRQRIFKATKDADPKRVQATLVALGACLSRGAWKTGTPGSEGAGAQQCAPATRRFRIQWKRKRGTNKWHVYTFIADRPFRSVKGKIRALTPRTSQQDLRAVLIRINQISRGWTNYFKHAVAKRTLSRLQHFTWWRLVRMMRTRHRWKWKDVRRWLTDPVTGRWNTISADGIDLFNPETIPITRYRYRGNKIPNPWLQPA